MKNLFLFLSIFTLVSFSNPLFSEAQEDSNIFISIGGALFQFNGPAGILSGASFGSDTIKFVVPPGINLSIITSEEKNLAVSPAQFSRVMCREGNNSIEIDTNKAAGPISFMITVKNGGCNSTGSSFINALENFKASPVTQKIVREVIVPVSITVTTVSAGTLVVSASVGSASFALNITQILQQLGILRFYALGLLRFRRKKPWGRAIERFSGRPLKGVLIQIYEAEFKKIKDAQLTDNDGRFSAVMSPGRYFIKASKAGFETQEIGSVIVNTADTILNLEIALSPNIKTGTSAYMKRLSFLHTVRKFLDLINPYLLAFGTLISLGAVLVIPNTINYAGFAIYILLDGLKIYFAKTYTKPFGKVLDASSNAPLSLVIVRIFDSEKQFLLSTKVTDNDGHFGFLLAPGKYYLTCAKSGYSAFKSPEIILRQAGLAALDIKMIPSKQ